MKECYKKALSVDADNAVAWFNLAERGGGEVDGKSYSLRECYEKALSVEHELSNRTLYAQISIPRERTERFLFPRCGID